MSSQETMPSLERILGAGVPPEAIAFYGRWWQLENWLRELVYVELRAKYGSAWTTQLEGHAPKRAVGDGVNAYMASADAGELITYADVADVFRLIEDHWELFEPSLPPLRRWQGRSEELRELRNRNAHCRRPHRDDLGRVEQVLRDLEQGALRFYASYVETHRLRKSRDPVCKSWIGRRHDAAARLIDHAERQYDVRFRLGYSVRPWAAAPDEDRISGTQGVLWDAHWTVAGREVNVAELWNGVSRDQALSEPIIHLLVDPGSVTATMAAVEDPTKIADTIGHVFDQILMTSRPWVMDGPTDQWVERFTRGVERLPGRVQVNSALTLVDPYEPGAFSLFGA